MLSKFIFVSMFGITTTAAIAQNFDIQGHRGARGLKPENTIPAFITALELGVSTLELDVVITKDKQVVVSHEPWMSSAICLEPNGSSYDENKEKGFNIYQMTYAEVESFDCGSKINNRFPEQDKIKTSKPLLKEVFKIIEARIKKEHFAPVKYSIEIKSETEVYGIFQPAPEEFSELVYAVINENISWERVIIQSFDFNVLQYWHKKYPDVTLSALVENNETIDDNLKSLGFKPHIYSPDYNLLDAEKINKLHAYNIRVIPWTVNIPAAMLRLKSWGVDGLISDYPDKAIKTLSKKR